MIGSFGHCGGLFWDLHVEQTRWRCWRLYSIFVHMALVGIRDVNNPETRVILTRVTNFLNNLRLFIIQCKESPVRYLNFNIIELKSWAWKYQNISMFDTKKCKALILLGISISITANQISQNSWRDKHLAGLWVLICSVSSWGHFSKK